MVFKRWGLFQRPLLVGMEKWALCIGVSFKLHNYCIERNVAMPAIPDDETGIAAAVVAANAAALTEHNVGSGRRTHLDDCPRRIQLTKALEEMRYLRPGSASRR